MSTHQDTIEALERQYGGPGLVCPVTLRKLRRPLTDEERAELSTFEGSD